MFSVIIGCLIANILTIAIILGAAYILYKKNDEKINAAVDKIEAKITEAKSNFEEIKSTVTSAIDSIQGIKSSIDSLLSKFPFSANEAVTVEEENK